MGIYNQNILRINLNELVQTRASLQGKNLTSEEADDYANKLRRQLNWDSMFEQIGESISNLENYSYVLTEINSGFSRFRIRIR